MKANRSCADIKRMETRLKWMALGREPLAFVRCSRSKPEFVGGRKAQQMRKQFRATFLPVLVFVGCVFLKPEARTVPHAQQPTTVPKPSVQVTSVTVEPSAIHKTQSPNRATVIAQIQLRGKAPSNAHAVVEVGTSSSDPPNNELRYHDPIRSVALQKGVTVVKFKAESTARTFAGKLKVAVTLGGATKGIKVKGSEPKDYMAEATILEP